jgi:hypothetical protein
MNALGTDILAQCLSFLPIDDAFQAKQISRATRSAARRVLTRGRWRPLWFLNKHGFDAIRGDRARRSVASIEKSVVESLPEATLTQFHAAWAIEPSEVLLQLNDWPFLHKKLPMMLAPSRLLQFVEPSIDGLQRVIAALERYYNIVTAHPVHPERALTSCEFPLFLIGHWNGEVDPDNDTVDIYTTDALTRELQHWSSVESAADFMIRGCCEFFQHMQHFGAGFNDFAEEYVDFWTDRRAASLFAEILRDEQTLIDRGGGRVMDDDRLRWQYELDE